MIQEPQRDLGLGGALSIGIGGIVGGGIFALLGIVVAETGGSAWVSYLVAGVVALLTAYSYSRLSITFPSSGGTVAFLNRGFAGGSLAGGLNSLLVLSYIVAMALYAATFATYASTFLPAHLAARSQPFIGAGILVLIGLANIRAPEALEKGEGLFNVIKLLVLGGFVVLGLSSRSLNLEAATPAHWGTPLNIFVTAMTIFLSYEGFELIANASHRVRQPERNLPIAFFGSILAAIVLYVCIVLVALGHLSVADIEAQKGQAVSAVASTFMGPAGFTIMALGAMVAAGSAINADYFGSSKLVAMLAESGPLPWRKANTRFGNHPWGMLFLMGVGVLAVTMLDLHALSSVSSAGFLMVFAAVNIANVRLGKETRSRMFISEAGVITCLAALGALVVQLAGRRAARHEAVIIVAMALLPLLYKPVDHLVRRIGVKLGLDIGHRHGTHE